jgi:putative phosphoribosyl transferase
MRFTDRRDAGQRLAELLCDYADQDVVVAGLPNGGVPVAAEVARALGAELDVILVRKLGVPSQPELALGAIGEGGARVFDEEVVRRSGVDPATVDSIEAREREVLAERAVRYRGGRPPLDYVGRTVLVVDDGIATGSTARAACAVARARGAVHVAVATPVAPADIEARLSSAADAVVCVHKPAAFGAVGSFYADFRHVPDDEVAALIGAPG